MATLGALPGKRGRRLFYVAVAILAAVIVLVGFARTYFLKAHFGTPALPPLLHLHGVLFSLWFVLLIAQTALVAVKRTDLHRKLGVLGAIVASLMIPVGLVVAIQGARRGATPGPPPLVFLAIPFFDILVFGGLVGAAFYFRRQPAIHKRLMIAATLSILPAAAGRLPFDSILALGPLAFFGLPDLLLVACIVYDAVANRRLHPAFLWGGLVVVLSHPLRLMVAGTDAWLAFARWLTA